MAKIENTALTAAKSSADEWMLRAKDITTEEAFQNLVNEYKAAQGQTVEEGQKIFGLVRAMVEVTFSLAVSWIISLMVLPL